MPERNGETERILLQTKKKKTNANCCERSLAMLTKCYLEGQTGERTVAAQGDKLQCSDGEEFTVYPSNHG